MSEEKKNLIRETVENLKCLDESSLQVMKAGAELLRARDALERREKVVVEHQEASVKAAGLIQV